MRIILFILGVFVIIYILKLYIMFGVEKIHNKFKSNYWDGLPDMIEKYKRTAVPLLRAE